MFMNKGVIYWISNQFKVNKYLSLNPEGLKSYCYNDQVLARVISQEAETNKKSKIVEKIFNK